MPHPWQPARLRRANRVQEDRTHHGRSQAFTAPATSHPPIESIRRTQTEPPHPGQLRLQLILATTSAVSLTNVPRRRLGSSTTPLLRSVFTTVTAGAPTACVR